MGMKRYRVFDIVTHAKSGEICMDEVCKMVRNFITILDVKKENIYVEDIQTGVVKRCEDILMCHAGASLCKMKQR